MGVRGVRGATTTDVNESGEIWSRTKELLERMIAENEVEPEQVAAVFITVTPDLNDAYPAKAVREIKGWELVPLMCSTEIPVPNGLSRCIRVMMLVNTDKSLLEIRHVFLRGAKGLRPDLLNCEKK